MSVDEADLRSAIGRLKEAGVASPDYDARALARLATERKLDFVELVSRRAAREPLQHIVGSTGFRYLELEVGPGVFVPRPETEVVVDAVLAELRDKTDPLVVDLCAGAGTIGFAVANEHPTARVHLVEKDEDAFAWLKRNRPEADARVQLHLDDAETALPDLDGSVDVVASNPPYVAEHEREQVEPEVREHDPAGALFAGPDGLDVIRVVASRAMRLLKSGGFFVVEHSDRQGESCPALLRDGGWHNVADHLDLTGRPRFSTARKP